MQLLVGPFLLMTVKLNDNNSSRKNKRGCEYNTNFCCIWSKHLSQDQLLQWTHATSYSGRSNRLRHIDVPLQQGPSTCPAAAPVYCTSRITQCLTLARITLTSVWLNSIRFVGKQLSLTASTKLLGRVLELAAVSNRLATGQLYEIFPWFYSTPSGKCRDVSQRRSRPYLVHLIIISNTDIRR
jgi:hypothetical protein